MRRTQANSRRREKKLSRMLRFVFVFILLAGLVSQITLLACISGQQKQSIELGKEIKKLEAKAGNLQLCVNQFKDSDRISLRAEELGMREAEETQLRVVSLPNMFVSTSTQSVENISAEEIFN